MKTRTKILYFLLALLISVLLWAYVVTTVTPEDSQTFYNVPITFANEEGLFSDRNLVLSEGRDATVSLRLHGTRQELAKLSSTNITLTADLSQVTGTGEWDLRYTIEYPDTVSADDISVESRSSSYVHIVVDRMASKTVEVRAVFRGDIAEGYGQDGIELEYDSIDVSGPRDLVDSVEYAQVELERTNVSSTVSDNLAFTLYDAEDEPVESDELQCTAGSTAVDRISVLMPVYMLKEVPLRVDLIEGGGATEACTLLNITPGRITLKGDPEILETLNSITLGTIDLSAVQSSVTQQFNIVIPDGLSNMTSDTADVSVEVVGLTTRTFQVTNIDYTNFSAENLNVQLNTISLQVQVRGPSERIEELAAGSIRAVADLSGISGTGQYSVPAEIYVDGASDVGAMGSYTVLVTISEQTSESAPVEVSESAETPEGEEAAPEVAGG